MNRFIARHRAVLGLGGVVALAALFASLAFDATSLWLELALVAGAAGGIYAIASSPYWRVVYRESPLRRAASGISDLDEREIALRDRAYGLTYMLFVAFNAAVLAACAALVDLGTLRLGAGPIAASLLPYVWFAVTLPVIMIEWFEPSGTAAADLLDEEAK